MKNLAIGPVLYICPQISPIEIKHHQPGGRSSNTFEVISKFTAVKESLRNNLNSTLCSMPIADFEFMDNNLFIY